MARKIEVEILGDSSSYQRALSGAQKGTSKFGKAAKIALIGGAAAGFYALGKAAKVGWDEFNAGQKEAAQTRAVIKSTGGAANVTAKHVQDMGTELMNLSGIDDELVVAGENLLLTFRNIHNEVGKGNDIFDQATKLTLDLATAMHTDMNSAAIQVGKALNDPIRGYSRLQRIGVTFSETQVKLIERFTKLGKTEEAQRVILGELAKEFGGSAKAAGTTLAGKLAILRERFNNFAGELVGRVLPALLSFVDFIDRVADAKDMKARVRIIFEGVRGAVGDLFDKIRDALLGTGPQPLKLDSGKIIDWTAGTPGLIASMKEMFNAVPWDVIGKQIGSAITIGTEWVSEALTTASDWLDAHSSQIGEMGAKLFATMVATLLDPAFWVKNWKLALAIAVAVIPVGRLVAIGGKLALFIARPFTKLFGTLVEKAIFQSVGFIIRMFEKLPSAVQKVFQAIVKFATTELDRFLVWLAKQLAKVPFWLKAAFRLAFVVSAFSVLKGAVEGVIGAVSKLIGWVKDAIGWVGHLLGMGGGNTGSAIGAAAAAAAAVPHGKTPPEAARGGHVLRTGLAKIHRGETITPARVAAAGGGSVNVIVLGGDREAINYLRQLDYRSSRRSGRGVF